MDVELARTFLAVIDSGSFAAAANQVCVTQSTVSVRIRMLEDRLGRRLFDRAKSGATPTPAGQRFRRHALAAVRIWENAKSDLALPDSHESVLKVGFQAGLWDGIAPPWLSWMRREAPEVALQADMLSSAEAAVRCVLAGTLDLALAVKPEQRPGLATRPLFEEHLVLVTSEPGGPSPGRPGKRYIFIDWGPDFRADHALSFPEMALPGMVINRGVLSLADLCEARASAYMPWRLAEPMIQAGDLARVPGAPPFTYPVYAAFVQDAPAPSIDAGLRGLCRVAAGHAPHAGA